MSKNPTAVLPADWQEKFEARNKALLELGLLEDMLRRTRSNDSRLKLKAQISAKRVVCEQLRTEMHALQALAKRQAHEKTVADDRAQRLRYERAFISVCKANLRHGLFEQLCAEANKIAEGGTKEPVTILGMLRHFFKKGR